MVFESAVWCQCGLLEVVDVFSEPVFKGMASEFAGWPQVWLA